MPRICVLTGYHWDVAQGGSEFRARALAERLAEDTRNDVVYLARHVPASVGTYPYRIRGFQGPRALHRPIWGMTPDSGALLRALVNLRPDVIVQFVASAYTGVAALYARVKRTPMIWCLSSDRDVEPRPAIGVSSPLRHLDAAIFRYGARHATHVVAQTVHQAERLAANYGRDPAAVIPNFHPAIEGDVDKAPTFTVLWVNNHKRLKRPECFIALAEAFLGCGGIRFRMIGREDSSAWGQHILARAERLDNLETIGQQPIERVNDELSRAHLLVNTSEYEGFPNTYIQAWLRETPTISMGVDPDGVIDAQGLGFIAHSTAELVDRVRSLYMDRRALDEMARRARYFAETHYSMRNLEEFVEIIGHCIAQRLVSSA